MNSINKNESNIISKILFVITLLMILTRKYMISTIRPDIPIDRITSLLFYGSIGLLFLQFLIRKRHNLTELIILGISIVLYIFTREGSLLVLILLAISIRDIDDSYVVKNYLFWTVVFVIGCMLMGNLLTDIAQVPQVHYRFEKGIYIQRETFGLGNPNSAFLFLLPVFASYIFLRFDKYNWMDRIILIGTCLYVYNKTMSRTGFITIVGALVFIEILRFIDFKKYPILGKAIKFMPTIFFIISVLIGTIFANVSFLNKALASRPLHWKAYLLEHGNMFTLFGNRVSADVKLNHPLDSSYIYMLAILGIVSLIFFMYLLYKGLDLFVKENNKKYIAIVVMFLVYSLAENILFEASYNFTIILLLKHIMNNNPNNFTVMEGFKYITNRK